LKNAKDDAYSDLTNNIREVPEFSSGMMNICYPVIALEPVLPKLASRDLVLNETSSKKSRNTELQVLLGGAKVNVEANLGNADLSMGDILGLKVGDVVRLSTPADDIVTVSGHFVRGQVLRWTGQD